MTRRDHCGNCDELVGDDDVMCTSCKDSYCAFCTNPYNAITRVAMVHARVNYTSYCMTEEELNVYIEDLKTMSKDKDYLYYIRDFDEDDKFPDFIRQLEQCTDLSKIKKFICNSDKGYICDFVSEEFVCEDCHEEDQERKEIDDAHKKEVALLTQRINELEHQCEMLQAHLNRV